MKNKYIFFFIILITLTILQIYGLIKYHLRLPDDFLGPLLYIVSIICLLAGLAIGLIRNKRIK